MPGGAQWQCAGHTHTWGPGGSKSTPIIVWLLDEAHVNGAHRSVRSVRLVSVGVRAGGVVPLSRAP